MCDYFVNRITINTLIKLSGKEIIGNQKIINIFFFIHIGTSARPVNCPE